ncbi:transcription antiterminator [Salicibibacter cibi]|uniref:Transcription antiterminator n=1 Tax=Salicibibacter cibi TaxID=2743001 RepID=A0A7T6ZBD2_9BACI|nr:BglG family transcription antiterminator [Salicibibacter cibi]QQK80393.1 transcription antiterminator [Salicibibacter cibi]
MKERHLDILDILQNESMPVTSSMLSKRLFVSSRTIRNDLHALRPLLESGGAKLYINRGEGIRLEIQNNPKFQQLLNDERAFVRENVSTPKERVDYLIRTLLFTKDFRKVDDLADEMFISRGTLLLVLQRAKEIFKEASLGIISKPYHGIKIDGDEARIRFFISNYSEQFEVGTKEGFIKTKDLSIVKRIILQIIDCNFINMSDIGFQNLATHIVITISRIKKEHLVDFPYMEMEKIRNHQEYLVAKEISLEVEKEFDVLLSEEEVAYIAIHLRGTKLVGINPDSQEATYYIDENTKALTYRMLRKISSSLDFNPLKDEELFLHLALHMKPAINRYKYHMNMKNPILKQIKTKYSWAFEIALEGSLVLKEQLNIEINEHEVGYIALHIQSAIERNQTYSNSTKKCLIVCASGVGSAQLIRNKLIRIFGNDLEIVGVTERFNIKQYHLRTLDFIVSTVPIQMDLPVPVVNINTIMEKKDLLKIEDEMEKRQGESVGDSYLYPSLTFLQKTFDDKEDVLKFLCDQLIKKNLVPSHFYENVLERENIVSTAFDNLIAIPHPLEPVTEETFWTVCTLKNPINWSGDPVQVICLLNIAKDKMENLQDMYQILTDFIETPFRVKTAANANTFHELHVAFFPKISSD